MLCHKCYVSGSFRRGGFSLEPWRLCRHLPVKTSRGAHSSQRTESAPVGSLHDKKAFLWCGFAPLPILSHLFFSSVSSIICNHAQLVALYLHELCILLTRWLALKPHTQLLKTNSSITFHWIFSCFCPPTPVE